MSNYHSMSDAELGGVIYRLANLVGEGQDLFPISQSDAKKINRNLETVKQILATDDPVERILLDRDSPECKAIVARLAKYAEENPLVTYQSQGEDLDNRPDLIQKLLDCKTEDEISDWYQGVYEMVDQSYFDCDYDFESDYWVEAWDEVIQGEEEFPFVPALQKLSGDCLSTLLDLLSDNGVYMNYDHTEHVDSIIGSTSVKVRAVVRNARGEPIETPHFENGDDYNRELGEYLNRVFKMVHDQRKPENWSDATYGGSYMVYMGSLDLMDIIKEKKVPNSIEVHPTDSYIFFAGWNGSGSCFEPSPTRAVRLRCNFLVDDAKCNRYGVDETYGFVHRVWSDNHNAFSYEWPDDVEAFVKTKNRTWKKLKVKK